MSITAGGKLFTKPPEVFQIGVSKMGRIDQTTVAGGFE